MQELCQDMPKDVKQKIRKISKMRNPKTEFHDPSPSGTQVIDLISEVKVLQGLNAQELTKLLKDCDNFLLLPVTENGSSMQIDMDKLARFLPLHLAAVLLSPQRDENLLRYLLSGLRLLYSLCEIASRFPKLEQILLDDVKVSDQLLDFVFYLLIVFSSCEQRQHLSGAVPLLHSALVACSMYLLTACISTQWHELAYVLQAHPKVDIFIDAAFAAVHRNINFLQVNLIAKGQDFCPRLNMSAEKTTYFFCQQCEASLQFLQSLCQHKSFRERLLKNKELCGKGGVLRLARAILMLDISPISKDSFALVAAVSRLKARVLSILLHLCEVESTSYLDEVASVPESLDLAKSVAVEVITLLKNMPSKDFNWLGNSSGKTYPMGLLQINALRLTDIFSDDSNFRSYITIYFTEVLAAIVLFPYQEFLSSWCSSELPQKEEDVLLEFDPFTSAGWILDLTSQSDVINVKTFEPNFHPVNNSQASYAHLRTSLLVKVIANLHCFVPKICKEQERNLFLHKFLERLKAEWQDPSTFSSAPEKAATVCKNIRALLGHAESLIPTFLNEEDVQLLRVFYTQLQSLIGPAEYEANRTVGIQNSRRSSSPVHKNVEIDIKSKNSNLKEGMSENSAFPGVGLDDANGSRQDQKIYGDKFTRVSSNISNENEKDVQNAETSGSDSSSTRVKNTAHRVANGEVINSGHHSKKSGDTNQLKKRKRNIMNGVQISMIEKALVDEPDLHRNATSLQSWADRLSLHGFEVTSSQLKNWLNNRKAKLARVAAAKDGRPPQEENIFHDKENTLQVRPSFNSPENLADTSLTPSTTLINMNHHTLAAPSLELSPISNPHNKCSTSSLYTPMLEAGQAVVLTDTQGKEIAKGVVFKVDGPWHGCNLEDTKTCVVDITELNPDGLGRLPRPPTETGTTFEETEIKVRNMRVLWDAGRVFVQK